MWRRSGVPEGQGATPRWRTGSATPPEPHSAPPEGGHQENLGWPGASSTQTPGAARWRPNPLAVACCVTGSNSISLGCSGHSESQCEGVSLTGLRDIAQVKNHIPFMKLKRAWSVPGTKWGCGPGALSSSWASGQVRLR